ncbi:MAG: STAS domain-containing protein [Xanthomonadales bacterium]|nr:STAS domain-containing protein [Xanthomonadales bacterium]
MALEVRRERAGEALILSLAGRLDAEGGEDLELAFHEAAHEPHATLLLDCGELAYASEPGVARLVESAARLLRPDALRLCRLRPELRPVFEAAGARFPVYATREDALATMQLRRELAVVDAVGALLRPPRLPPSPVSGALLDQAARLLGVSPERRGPTAAPAPPARPEPARATWVAERPSLLVRRAAAPKRHPFIRWLRRLIGERD